MVTGTTKKKKQIEVHQNQINYWYNKIKLVKGLKVQQNQKLVRGLTKQIGQRFNKIKLVKISTETNWLEVQQKQIRQKCFIPLIVGMSF